MRIRSQKFCECALADPYSWDLPKGFFRYNFLNVWIVVLLFFIRSLIEVSKTYDWFNNCSSCTLCWIKLCRVHFYFWYINYPNDSENVGWSKINCMFLLTFWSLFVYISSIRQQCSVCKPYSTFVVNLNVQLIAFLRPNIQPEYLETIT